MKIAIHKGKSGFAERWVKYCNEKRIEYKIVDCYKSDIIHEVAECDIVMWHHSQGNHKDLLIAKPILFALQQTGKVVFPDFNTGWHFDDKVGQKYLFEALGLPFVNTYTFLDKKDALSWIKTTTFPKVFKLRGGAGSTNVKLVNSFSDAKKLVKRAFKKGFRQYEPWSNLKERWRLFKLRKTNSWDIIKGLIRFFYEPEFSKTIGWERGYIYFQDFIPNNEYDIRVIVIDGKAFAIKRMVRKGDFRASGSGNILYEKMNFPDEVVALSFTIADQLKSQCVAFDFVFQNDRPLLVEISYAFIAHGYDPCVGFWKKDMTWVEGSFNPYAWMVESVINQAKCKK